ncbi:MAG: DUF1569 domain-containing protein [Flavobacteriales bacterium]|jgi:oxepin-CoA hydrolase/3-oxo-5,6-dehydrosuberyl-CoA semialdehyde dehydrogenase|nr:DUF1569 domain-containing protein [Flavobacteriales bacterium]NCG29527.1 DUF1569 domain-containing protein [Bacteroidota bacterium]MBT3963318.1 DUF1569 domain-containing protein [Flavobacteriales bacterium]MBT4705509.1 DUF1569 domain-containing protein [Flavobacteriales bacterium]MBT4930831.1 DUF1569 domain-containing protein [Flavobacteriales bacterium]
MLQAEDKSFFISTIGKLRGLKEDSEPSWGRMTPQHMVEHIVGSWRISNGRARIPVKLEGEELQKRRDFLFSDMPYRRNIQNPIFKDGELPKLRKPSLEAAINQLDDEMTAFFEYHDNNPGAIENHPVFGALNFDEWMLFQTKHMKHHLEQFDVL